METRKEVSLNEILEIIKKEGASLNEILEKAQEKVPGLSKE